MSDQKPLHIKTSKGTELPLLDLRGKPYLQVPHRMVWFREEHPDWVMEVTFHTLNDVMAMARAEIKDLEGKIRAVAHKVEHKAHFSDYVEKAETGAIGRALGMLGYGTAFADEFFEGERLADAPANPAKKPVQQKQQEKKQEEKPKDPALTLPTNRELTANERVVLSQWVMPGGKFQGKKMSEVPQDDLKKYWGELQDKATAGENLSQGLRLLMIRFEQYCTPF